MKYLSDSALQRLQQAADLPDLTGTRYRVVDKLGQGGMGGVFRVEDTLLGRQVALKVISAPGPERQLAARLEREARVIAQLEHPGIVPVHDAGTLADGRNFYTMKLVQGKRLDEYVRDVRGVADRMRIFLRICDAVGFAHAHGVLHRDLKPGNIMVGPFGEVLVMDWGLSKLLQPGEPSEGNGQGFWEKPIRPSLPGDTAHGAVLGTPGYMAPEQAAGTGGLDQRADVYSLGALLQFLLVEESQEPVPGALAAACRKAMAPEPAERYPAVPELAQEVAHYLDGLPVSAYPEGMATRLWRWSVRHRAWILLLLAYVLMRALLILWRPG
jgi:eukaryotic-like serine/threonine-protein kinase